MKNFALFLAIWAVATTGAYAQGRLSPDADNSDPNQSYQAAHQTKTTKDVVSSEGLIAAGPKLARTGWVDMDASTPTVAGGRTISLQKSSPAQDLGQPAQPALSSTDSDDPLMEPYQLDRSKGPQFSANNFRAWDYGADESDLLTAWSNGGIAVAASAAVQNAAGNNGTGAGNGNTTKASAGPAPQTEDAEIINLGGPQRMVIPNIASPEPNTIALGLLGGAALGWRKLARSSRNRRG
jgi:hypothetical protein